MDLYSGALLLGAAGLGLMALGGFGARGGKAGSHGHSTLKHAGHGHGGHGAHSAGHSHGPSQPAHGHGSHGHHAPASTSRLSDTVGALLSVRMWFSLFVGFGAAGLLLRNTLGGPFLFAAALAAGLAFEFALVAPFWRFLFRFASSPALTLESILQDRVLAVTSFDANGHGLVSVDVDGQVRQILATLRPEDRESGKRVRAGDEVRIEEVDSQRNRCTVSITHD